MCSITIRDATGVTEPDGIISNVTLVVETEDCVSESVIVRFSCEAIGVLSRQVSATGLNVLEFPEVKGFLCRCGEDVTVRVMCSSATDDCFDETTLHVPCPDAGCPTIDVSVTAAEGDCVNGRRRVQFDVDITPGGPGPVITQIEFEPGVYSEAETVTQFSDDPEYSVAHPYVPPGPGENGARLIVVFPEGCDDQFIDIPPLDECGKRRVPGHHVGHRGRFAHVSSG